MERRYGYEFYCIQYGGKFSLVWNFAEMHPDSSEDIFPVFIFAKWMRDALNYKFVAILYSSRLIIIYSDHLESRHTVENHLVYMGTSSYWCMQYWRHNSIFRGFYFRWSRSVRENLHPAKMSHCMVFCKYSIFISVLFFSSQVTILVTTFDARQVQGVWAVMHPVSANH